MTYYIARMNEEGNWEYLDNMPTYSDAEALLDAYWNMYPHAYIDIVSAN